MANHGVLSKLETHHATIRRLIRDIHERIDEGDGSYGRVYPSLRRELLSHSSAEEDVLFPALAAHASCRDDVRDARDEHEEIQEILHELDRAEDDVEWLTTFQELEDAVEHHIREVEGVTFARAAEVLGSDVIHALGIEYQRRRHRVREGHEPDDEELEEGDEETSADEDDDVPTSEDD